jgi:hypothetical protein
MKCAVSELTNNQQMSNKRNVALCTTEYLVMEILNYCTELNKKDGFKELESIGFEVGLRYAK